MCLPKTCSNGDDAQLPIPGFDYEINALDEEKPSELSKVFNDIFIFDNSIPLLEILRVLVPPLQAIIVITLYPFNR